MEDVHRLWRKKTYFHCFTTLCYLHVYCACERTQLFSEEPSEKVSKESGLGFGEGVGAGLGIGLFLVLLCVCGGAVWLRRRQWQLPCGSKGLFTVTYTFA